jgi:hypothetical protein
MSTSVSKNLSIHVDPEPTFQGILWHDFSIFGITYTNTSLKESFDFLFACPTNASLVANCNGGDGTSAGQIVIPAFAQQRNCRLHLQVAWASVNGSFVGGDNYMQLNYDQIAPAVPNTINVPNGDLTSNGSYDYAFVLNAGKAYSLNLLMKGHLNVSSGVGNFMNVHWSGYLEVQTYS